MIKRLAKNLHLANNRVVLYVCQYNSQWQQVCAIHESSIFNMRDFSLSKACMIPPCPTYRSLVITQYIGVTIRADTHKGPH